MGDTEIAPPVVEFGKNGCSGGSGSVPTGYWEDLCIWHRESNQAAGWIYFDAGRPWRDNGLGPSRFGHADPPRCRRESIGRRTNRCPPGPTPDIPGRPYPQNRPRTEARRSRRRHPPPAAKAGSRQPPGASCRPARRRPRPRQTRSGTDGIGSRGKACLTTDGHKCTRINSRIWLVLGFLEGRPPCRPAVLRLPSFGSSRKPSCKWKLSAHAAQSARKKIDMRRPALSTCPFGLHWNEQIKSSSERNISPN